MKISIWSGLGLLLWLAAAASGDDALLRNPALAVPPGADAPEHWSLTGTAAQVTAQADGVRLTAGAHGAGLAQMVGLQPGREYIVTWEACGAGEAQYKLYVEWTKGAEPNLIFEGANSNEVYGPTSEWRASSFRFVYPPGCNGAYLAWSVRSGEAAIRALELRDSGRIVLDGEAASWTLTGGATRTADGILLAGAAATAALPELILPPGSTYTLRYAVRAVGRGNGIGVQNYGVELNGAALSCDTWSDFQQYKSVNFSVPESGRMRIVFSCPAADGVKLSAVKVERLEEVPPPLAWDITAPLTATDLLASAPEQRLSGTVTCHLSTVTAIRCRLLNSGGEVLAESATAEFDFDLAALPPGSYRLTAEAYDDAGQVSATAELPCRVLPPNHTEFAIGSDKQLYHNGNPLYPVLLWTPIGRNCTEEELRQSFYELARNGVNFIVVFYDTQNLATVVDIAGDYGIFVLYECKFTGDGDQLNPEGMARLRRVVTAEVLADGAFAGYLLSDEPAWGGIAPAALRQAYDAVREFDPYRLRYINEAPRGDVVALARYDGTCDLYGADIYPIPYGYGHSALPEQGVDAVGAYTRRMRSVGNDRRPIWMVLQTFAWGSLFGQDERIYPDLAQMRFMTFAALANGAVNANYWGVDSIDRADFLDEVFALTREQRRLSGMYVLPRVPGEATFADPAIRQVVWRGAAAHYLLAVNESDRAVETEFSVAFPADGLTEYFSGAQPVLTDGTGRDHFAPWECKLYVTGDLPPPLWALPPQEPEREQVKSWQRAAEERGAKYQYPRYRGAADWIWVPALSNQASTGEFRCEFELPTLPENARCFIVHDDALLQFAINGTPVPYTGTGWNIGAEFDARPYLRPGTNRLEMTVENYLGVGGLLLDLNLHFSDGSSRTIRSDDGWRGRTPGSEAWGPVEIVAPYGSGAWGDAVRLRSYQ